MSFQINIFGKFLSSLKEVDNLNPKIEPFKKLKKIKVTGYSRMHDPADFYDNFASELENYFYEFKRTLILEFYFEYINTGSAKWLYYVLAHLQELLHEGGLIEVVWRYDADDESIEETGQVLKAKLNLPFLLKPST